METLAYRDFREFVEKAQEVSDWRLVEGADWDKEIGALIEATAELPQPPMLVFEKIKDYPAGFRLGSIPYAYSEFQLWLCRAKTPTMVIDGISYQQRETLH